jgi:hypothetical protein
VGIGCRIVDSLPGIADGCLRGRCFGRRRGCRASRYDHAGNNRAGSRSDDVFHLSPLLVLVGAVHCLAQYPIALCQFGGRNSGLGRIGLGTRQIGVDLRLLGQAHRINLMTLFGSGVGAIQLVDRDIEFRRRCFRCTYYLRLIDGLGKFWSG